MIAMALACDPTLLIADEPTTALDVTIQDQILELLAATIRDKGMSMTPISHDLYVVADTCGLNHGHVCRTPGRGGTYQKKWIRTPSTPIPSG